MKKHVIVVAVHTHTHTHKYSSELKIQGGEDNV